MHFKSFINHRIVQITVFWAISFFILLRIFTRTEEVREIDVIYTSLFHIPLMIAVSIHSQSLSRFLDKTKYVLYAIAVVISLLLSIATYFLVFNFLSDLLFSDFYFIAVYEWFEIAGITLIYLITTLLLHLASGWFRQQETVLELAQAQEEKVKAELQALRAQVNPHFLFNSLNMIYGEALSKSDKAPSLILELSEILRYVVDNSDRDLVSLNEELQYIDKFVRLQKERLNLPDSVTLLISGDAHTLRITPLLLITFVENCFKHGSVTDPSDQISITISISGSVLTMKTLNTVNPDSSSFEPGRSTGLANAERRLSLVYPERHTLEYEVRDEHFHLTLTLTLN